MLELEQTNIIINVTVAYKGSYTNGNVFDKSSDAGISFGLQQVIKGWTEGIFFKEGGSGMLLVPSHLGYGSNDSRGFQVVPCLFLG
jgi:FKBP-type peptidyl-prolyl cis-trans isomerase FkpA